MEVDVFTNKKVGISLLIKVHFNHKSLRLKKLLNLAVISARFNDCY
jgi:hypothetical protein